MKNKRDTNFRATTKSLFLKYAIIPYLVVLVLLSIFTLLLLNIKTIYDTKKSTTNIEEKLHSVYEVYSNEIDRMSQLPQIIETLNTGKDNHLIYEEFYNFNNKNEVQSVFHLIDHRNVFLVSTTLSVSENNQFILKDIVPYINKNPNNIYVSVESMELSNGKTTVLNLSKAIIDQGQKIGYLIYQIYEEDLEELIFGEKADIVVVTDYYDYVIASTHNITTGIMNKFSPNKISKSYIQIKDDKYYVSSTRLKDNLFTIYTMTNMKNDLVIYLLYILFISFTGIFLYFLLRNMAGKMSAKNAESIEKLMTAVAKLEKGDMTAFVSINTNDEFELLANQYNEMLVNLNQLIKQNEELSNIRKAKEIKLLESQFNPHFMFNVLETLKYAIVMDQKEAHEIILSLSRVLRYSIDRHNYEVLFKKDLNYIIDFLKLHKYRFRDRLEYSIDIDERVIQSKVPKLLLQPIIENAIKYGYENQTHLEINIRATIEKETIIFKVADNGNGIDRLTLHRIRESLNLPPDELKDIGIGIYNTHRRIILQYGEKYGLSLESEIEKGTEVTLTIPFYRGDEM